MFNIFLGVVFVSNPAFLNALSAIFCFKFVIFVFKSIFNNEDYNTELVAYFVLYVFKLVPIIFNLISG